MILCMIAAVAGTAYMSLLAKARGPKSLGFLGLGFRACLDLKVAGGGGPV